MLNQKRTHECAQYLHGLSRWGSGQDCLPAQEIQEMGTTSLGQEDRVEEEMASRSSIPGLENSTDRATWRATVHGVAESAVTACTHTNSHRENMEGCSIPEGTRRTPRDRQRTAGATCSRQGEPTWGLERNEKEK